MYQLVCPFKQHEPRYYTISSLHIYCTQTLAHIQAVRPAMDSLDVQTLTHIYSDSFLINYMDHKENEERL